MDPAFCLRGISSNILFSVSTQEVWDDLKLRFQKCNGPRIFHLKRELAHTKQNQDSVIIYFAKIKSLWDNYITYKSGCSCTKCTCGGNKKIEKFIQLEILISFFMGLNNEFGHAHSQILLMVPPLLGNEAFSLIVQEEGQMNLDSIMPSTMSFAVGNSKSNPNPSRFVQSANAASQTLNAQLKARNQNKPICAHRNILGHPIDKCYKVHGYPPRYKHKGNQRNGSQHQNNSLKGSNFAVAKNVSNNHDISNVEDPFAQCHNILNILQSKLVAAEIDSGCNSNQ